MANNIQVKVMDKVLHVVLNRPEKKNALTQEMYIGLANAIKSGEENSNVKVILIYGNGDSFCAGNDVKEFQESDSRIDSENSPSIMYIKQLMKAQKPIIAAVKGYVIGGGFTMLLHYDLVYAAKDTKFQLPFVKLALTPEFGSSFNLPFLVGRHRAAEILYFGDFITAEEACKMGIVNEVFEKDELMNKVLDKVRQLTEKPLVALKNIKNLLKKYPNSILEKTIPGEMDVFFERMKSPEAQEAFNAYFEKRKPDFSKFE